MDRCVLREAPRKKAPSAELLIQEKNDSDSRVSKTLVIQVCSHSFLEMNGTNTINSLHIQLINLMRRELQHVSDMLDEQFGYVRESFTGDPSQQNLQRDRYRILWDTFVESRLELELFGVDGKKHKLAQAFGRVFAPPKNDERICAYILDAPSLTHHNFMDWVREPASHCDELPDSNRVAANLASA